MNRDRVRIAPFLPFYFVRHAIVIFDFSWFIPYVPLIEFCP